MVLGTLPLSWLSNLGAHLEDGMSDTGFTEVLCNTQALEKAEAEVKLLSEEDRILCATIIERKPQVVRVAADISQAQEQKVHFPKISGCYKMKRKTCIYLFMDSSPNSPWMSESWYLSLQPYSKNRKKKE